ncbi:MAG: hypothetical protein JXR40_06845 [Pontiellaceae bacterium]|nr:hypothetical protein [Pontiellaceae bacterium]
MDRHVHVYVGMEAFSAEGERLFGKKRNNWKFQCPVCGNVHEIGKKPGADLTNRLYQAMEYCKKCNLRLWGGYADDPEGSSIFSDNTLSASIQKPHSGRIIMRSPGSDRDIDKPIFDFYRGNDPDFNPETIQEIEA